MSSNARCRGERVSNVEASVRRQDGRIIPVSINTDFLTDEKGQLIGLIEVIRDTSFTQELSKKIVEVNDLKHRLEERTKFFNMVGESQAIQEIFSRLPAISTSHASTLITGESGTGKELIAYAIHANSWRKSAPFVVVNCSSLAEGLIESELFGHVKGAFTGAYVDKVGRFERAHRGTVFLDEVGDINLTTQVKLLRALEKGEVERVGSNETVKVDVRVVAATNKNLLQEVKRGAFREDLYYRIRVLSIDLPPLRDRLEDLPLLVNHCIRKFNKSMNKKVQRVSVECLDVLAQYQYPGNIRELQNIIEHAFVCCDNHEIRTEHLPLDIQRHSLLNANVRKTDSLRTIEREAIYQVLSQTGWKYSEASKRLGIGRSTLWRKVKQYGISNQEGGVSQ